MHLRGNGHHQGLDALRRAVAEVLLSSVEPRLAPAAGLPTARSPFLLAAESLVRPPHDSMSHGVADGPTRAPGAGVDAGSGGPGPGRPVAVPVAVRERT